MRVFSGVEIRKVPRFSYPQNNLGEIWLYIYSLSLKINLFDLTNYLPGQLLTKVDRTSMMNSLEIRSPFLDYRLAEYVYNIPLEYKTDRKTA